MALYLAFDVGGTKTACVLADEERVLARAEGGSIKTLRIPSGEARANLEAVLLQLVSEVGPGLRQDLRPDLRQVRRTCIGTSGISAPAVRQWMEQAIAETIGSELVLLGDEVIAIDAAFPGARGVLVIAGTGSNIVGRAATGQMAHAGGWGPMLSDQGSGHWIGHQALRACFRAIDAAPASSADFVPAGQAVAGQICDLPFAAAPGGVSPSSARSHAPSQPESSSAGLSQNFFSEPNPADLPPLLRRFLDYLGLPNLEAIIGAANAVEFRFAQLVPTLVQAANLGDPLALATLRDAGESLARLVAQTIRKVEGLEAGLEVKPGLPEIAYIGGVLTHIPQVRAAMHQALDHQFPGIVLHAEPADALAGALWHARGRPTPLRP